MTKASNLYSRVHAARLVALGAISIAIAACGEEPAAVDPVRPVLSMVLVDEADFSSRRFVGQANAVQEIDAAFEVSGRLIERPVDVGSEVRRGDLLARLDPRDFEADLAGARANEAKARADHLRASKLFEAEVIPEAELEAALRRLEVTQAELRKADKAIEDTRLLAPFDGAVAATYVENFQNVRQKQAILRLLDTSHIEVVIDMPEDRIGSVSYVSWVKVRFDVFPDHEIDAQIKEVGNEASATTRTYPVTLVLEPPAGADIKPGMSAVVWAGIDYPKDVAKQGLEVPVAAVFSRPEVSPGESFVWIVAAPALTLALRRVEMLGASSHGISVRGIELGERIVIAGVHSLHEGMRVRLIDEAPGGSARESR